MSSIGNQTGLDPLSWIAGDLAAIPRAEWGYGIPSGSYWVEKFPNCKSVSALSPLFRPKVESFLAALDDAGATVVISATRRSKERAYLMHYCGLVGTGALSPTAVPGMSGVCIDWAHRDANGKPNLAAAREAAEDMMDGYDIAYPAALATQHIPGNAIDMTISWIGDLTIVPADGKDRVIKSKPHSGQNPELWEVGAGYGVMKLRKDKPHWSLNGH